MADKKGSIGVTIFFLIVSVCLIFLSIYNDVVTTKQQENISQQITETVSSTVVEHINQPSQFPDYSAALSFNSTTIISDHISYAIAGKPTGRVTTTLSISGKFQRMYFLIEASVDSGKPLTVYDDIFLAVHRKGLFSNQGHVLPGDSLKTPPSDISSLLYSAETLKLKSGRVVNALELFNTNKNVEINTFLSSARDGGMLKNFVIYYECLKGTECNIEKK